MITTAVKKLINKMKKADPEFAQTIELVSAVDSRANCIYFDRFTKVVSGDVTKKGRS